MSKGYVYVLTNEHMPGLVKIGRTIRDIHQRAEELFTTGVPTPFIVAGHVLSPDCEELERQMHIEFGSFRVSENREFFACDPNHVLSLLEEHMVEQVRELVGEFTESHSLVEDIFLIDPSDAFLLADALGAHVQDVATSIGLLTPEELAPALKRWEARKAHNAANRAERQQEASDD